MARFWVVDTNLVVDWCLFEMAEQSNDPALATIAQRLRYLPLAIYRDAFVEQLRTRRVAMPLPVAVETGWVSHRLIGRGVSTDFLETVGQFIEQIPVEVIRTEHLPAATLMRSATFTPASYSDASLVVLAEMLSQERHEPTILTGEQHLVVWCAQNRVAAERFEFRAQ